MQNLINEINRVWKEAYPDANDVTDEKSLCIRIRSFADDRECWRFNAVMNQKENNRLEKIQKEKP